MLVYLLNMLIFHSCRHNQRVPHVLGLSSWFQWSFGGHFTAVLHLSMGPNLVGGWPTPLKNMSSSVGMMTFLIYGKIKFMFQTTNQPNMWNSEVKCKWIVNQLENLLMYGTNSSERVVLIYTHNIPCPLRLAQSNPRIFATWRKVLTGIQGDPPKIGC